MTDDDFDRLIEMYRYARIERAAGLIILMEQWALMIDAGPTQAADVAAKLRDYARIIRSTVE